MTIRIQKIQPQDIEAESFRIISKELGKHNFPDEIFPIVQRVIHATGDFSFASNLRFSADALETGLHAIQRGKTILTDVNMVAAGISAANLRKWGNRVICLIGENETARRAQELESTRAEAAMELALAKEDIGIIAIGNAPTALLKAMSILENTSPASSPLLVGVPVGFVNALESKSLLSTSSLPHITSLGRKGGSPVAAAIVNAMAKIAGI